MGRKQSMTSSFQWSMQHPLRRVTVCSGCDARAALGRLRQPGPDAAGLQLPAGALRCALASTQPPGADQGCCTFSYSMEDIHQTRHLHAWQMIMWCRARLSIADRQADGGRECENVSRPQTLNP